MTTVDASRSKSGTVTGGYIEYTTGPPAHHRSTGAGGVSEYTTGRPTGAGAAAPLAPVVPPAAPLAPVVPPAATPAHRRQLVIDTSYRQILCNITKYNINKCINCLRWLPGFLSALLFDAAVKLKQGRR